MKTLTKVCLDCWASLLCLTGADSTFCCCSICDKFYIELGFDWESDTGNFHYKDVTLDNGENTLQIKDCGPLKLIDNRVDEGSLVYPEAADIPICARVMYPDEEEFNGGMVNISEFDCWDCLDKGDT